MNRIRIVSRLDTDKGAGQVQCYQMTEEDIPFKRSRSSGIIHIKAKSCASEHWQASTTKKGTSDSAKQIKKDLAIGDQQESCPQSRKGWLKHQRSLHRRFTCSGLLQYSQLMVRTLKNIVALVLQDCKLSIGPGGALGFLVHQVICSQCQLVLWCFNVSSFFMLAFGLL
jgi:hypothetical protein